MSQFFEVHRDNPQPRLMKQAAAIIREGGIAVIPTDSCYALACHLDDKSAVERIRRIREVGKNHNFTLMCRDLAEIATYARVENNVYRLLKSFTPGAYTFLLRATAIVPRRLQHPKRKTIGIRVPDSAIVGCLLNEFGEPLMTSTLILPGSELPETDAYDIREKLEHDIDLVVDGGHCGIEPTTVVDLLDAAPKLVRQGKGPIEGLIE
ncbi:MAG: L-threonylcarbamoyladenylate synthase [Gammaproteobacteria bacterium]